MTARITLPDGATAEISFKTTAKNWKSALMRRFPYGTVMTGARFEIVRP